MEEAETVVAAEGLGVRTRRGPVFSGVTLYVRRAEVVAVAGPAGSGRTSLLLTVGGRMRPSAGTLRVCGLPLPAAAARVRARTAVARAGGAAEPEPGLRVGEHVRERRLTLRGAEPFPVVCETLGVRFRDKDLVGDLPADETTVLALALALLERPEVVLLDDLDRGVDGGAQRRLWATMRRAADAGTAVLATTTDLTPAAGIATTILPLPAPDPPRESPSRRAEESASRRAGESASRRAGESAPGPPRGSAHEPPREDASDPRAGGGDARG